ERKEPRDMTELYKIPLVLSPQPEGGYVVTSPVLPELVTEGDTPDDVMDNVRDALDAALELYEDEGRPLPVSLKQDPQADPIEFE
ncbi:MAG: type II toxin-antitoxin system HicB family antitoxin, partial [Arenicellales bacterium]|nr:type II toxin-antitoxin system HicB family antitoxin [Arenicellales bacterium]